MPKLMQGDIVAFMYNGKIVKAQVVRKMPLGLGEFNYTMMDCDGRLYRKSSSDGLYTIGQVLGDKVVLTTSEASEVKRKTSELLSRDTVKDVIDTITEKERENKAVASTEHGKLEIWDFPSVLAVGKSSIISPELERYLTWSETYKRRFEEALAYLRGHAPKTYEAYFRCVLGNTTQEQLAKERGLKSRKGINNRKRDAEKYIEEEMKKVWHENRARKELLEETG